MEAGEAERTEDWPTVTVVFLVYNRREHLRVSLTKTLELDYPADRFDVIVVDNASTDGSADMVEADFPAVRLIRRTWNCGVSGWNDGFAIATGEFVLALDDDCYLSAGGLRRAVAEAGRHQADLVSFGVTSANDEGHRFELDEYLTGLFTYWGCAVLIRRVVLDEVHGYDPEIFVWANELDFTMRCLDRGFRHLYLPEVVAVHEKAPGDWRGHGPFPSRAYRLNQRHFGYIAAKLLRPRDAFEALFARIVRCAIVGCQVGRVGFQGIPDTLRGFAHGLRHRQPVRREVSRTYRRNFQSFASPWWVSRPLGEVVLGIVRPGRAGGDEMARRDAWLAERARFYPGGWTLYQYDPARRVRVGEQRSAVLQL